VHLTVAAHRRDTRNRPIGPSLKETLTTDFFTPIDGSGPRTETRVGRGPHTKRREKSMTASLSLPLSFRPCRESVAEKYLMVCKKSLRLEQIENIALAREMASRMVVREASGPGDIDNAMRRIEARYGVPYSLLWALRYRPPKDILLSPYRLLCAAYEAEVERQMRCLKNEIEITKAKCGADRPAVRAAEALVRQGDKRKS
jgi:hypothetical protein